MRTGTEFPFTSDWLEKATGGRIHGKPHGDSVVTDSRGKVRNALFVALRGPHFDGHEFVASCLRDGAGGAVVNQTWWDASSRDEPAVVVSDTLEALQKMAAQHRRRHSVPLIALTGSNGKTSTKEFVAAFVRNLGPVHSTRGNLNNHVGLPLTLLELCAEHVVSVVEMGMNHPGEITLLSTLAQPQVAVITNIAQAHLEGLGNREGVARAKVEITRGMNPDGVLILPHGDADLDAALTGCSMRRITVGSHPQATYRWDAPHIDEDGTRFRAYGPAIPESGMEMRTRHLGFHCAQNITLALAAAQEIGVPPTVAQSIAPQVSSIPGRLQLKRLGGLIILDDTYNANPASLVEALRVLRALPGRRHLAVLGDMLELGPHTEFLHRDAGANIDLDGLVTVGTVSRLLGQAARVPEGKWVHTLDPHEAAASIATWAQGDAVVLIKGSRGMRLENVLHAIGGGDRDAL